MGLNNCSFLFRLTFFKKNFFTFDINPDKISFIRNVINDAICRPLKINIFDYWTYVPNNSLDKFTGTLRF